MASFNWFRQRKVKKQSSAFWVLIEQNEIKAALQLYESHLLRYSSEVSKPLRAAYHFYRWLERSDEQDFRAVQQLAIHESGGSQVARTAHLMRRYKREMNLALALRQRTPKILTASAEPADFSDSQTFETLGLAILETYRLKQDSNDVKQIANTVQRLLPPSDKLNAKLLQTRDLLFVWAMWNLNLYSAIFEDIGVIHVLPENDRKIFKLATIYAWGRNELIKGHPHKSLEVLGKVEDLADTNQFWAMIFQWGLIALKKELTDLAIDWFSYHFEKMGNNEPQLWRTAISFALGVAYFQNEQFVKGQEVLDQLASTLVDNNDSINLIQTINISSEELLSQIEFLKGLSLFAEANSRIETDSESSVQNRAIWGTLQTELQSIVTTLSNVSSPFLWKRHLLAGLLAYVHSNSALSIDQVQQFSSAIEYLPKDEARFGLQAIASTLLSRAKATDEAINLIQGNEYAKLQELNDQILIPLGDAIPSLMRATVYMILWERNPSYDPLPDLQRIPLSSGDEELINRCVSQVQAVNTLQHLRELCARLPTTVALRIPPLTSLDFDASAATLGILASAVIQLHQRKWSEALDIIAQIDVTENRELLEIFYFIQFYAAWRLGDVQFCRSISPKVNGNRFLERSDNWQTALAVRSLVDAVESGQEELTFELLNKNDIFFAAGLTPSKYLNILGLQEGIGDNEISDAEAIYIGGVKDHIKAKLQDLQYRLANSEISREEFDARVVKLETEKAIKLSELENLAQVFEQYSELGNSTIDSEKIFERLIAIVTSLTVWLINKKKAQTVIVLFDIIRKKISDTSNDVPPSQIGQLDWMLSFLSGVIAAHLGQFTTCVTTFERVTSQSHLVDNTKFIHLLGWAKLFKLEAELALVAQSVDSDDIRVRWPSLRRSLETQAQQLKETPILQAYGFLIIGLVSFLSADILISEETLQKLAYAQRLVPTNKHLNFVEGVIGQLAWRKKIIEEFWVRLSQGDFKESRLIYKEQLEPAFGERMPHSIQLGIIMADWDANTYSTTELLQRLTILEHDAPELSRDLTKKVRDYILDGDRIRHFTQLIKDHDFETIIQFVEQTEWAGFEPGSMPVPVAIALLYAYHKKKRTEDAKHLGEIIRKSQGLSGWVKDYGLLLLGYVLFDNKDYSEAADAFGGISTSQLLKHDVDRYWAASHFSSGLQLLAVENRKDAFDSFSRSLGKRGVVQENVNLVPLFVHFGVKNIEFRNGTRAQQAFRLMKQSLEGLEETSEPYKYLFVADLGLLLCKSLIEQETEILDGKSFLELVDNLNATTEVLSIGERQELERVCRILAICQEFRKERRCDPRHRKSPDQLREYLRTQIDALEELDTIPIQSDPVLMVLKSLIELRLKKTSNTQEAIESITNAMRLGVQSRRLVGLLEEQRGFQKAAIENKKAILDLFDMYLSMGSIPSEIRDELVRHDDVTELYRLNRNYAPSDLGEYQVKSGVEIMCERVKHLLAQIHSEEIDVDGEIHELVERANKRIKEVQDNEKDLIECEQKILKILAQTIRHQAL